METKCRNDRSRGLGHVHKDILHIQKQALELEY
jgi:hypothetical protein